MRWPVILLLLCVCMTGLAQSPPVTQDGRGERRSRDHQRHSRRDGESRRDSQGRRSDRAQPAATPGSLPTAAPTPPPRPTPPVAGPPGVPPSQAQTAPGTPSVPTLINGRFSPEASLRLSTEQRAVAPGEPVTVTATAHAGDQPQKIAAGVVLSYDGAVLKFVQVTPGNGVQIVDQKDRESGPDRRVIRVRFASSEAATVASVNLEFTAVSRGESVLEPLSLDSVNRPGKTFLSLDDVVSVPSVGALTISVK